MSCVPRFRVLATTALAVALLALVAEAQPRRGGQPRGRFPMMRGAGRGVMGLLMREEVRAELKVTEAQQAKLAELRDKMTEEMRGRFSGLRDLSAEERAQRMEQFRKEAEKRAEQTEKEIAKILEPAQVKRLNEIELQQQLRGPGAVQVLLRSDISEALALTGDQKSQLQELVDQFNAKSAAMREKTMALFQRGRGASEQEREKRRQQMEEFRSQSDALQKEAQKAAVAVLTDTQKAKLKELAGTPFELPERGPGVRGRGGFRPGGAGAQGPRRQRGGGRSRQPQ
jgi:hypothetical protein